MPCLCRAPTMPLCKWLLKATARPGRGTAWCVWINIGRLSTAYERSARVHFFRLPRGVSRLAVRNFPATRELSRRTWHCRRTAGAQASSIEPPELVKPNSLLCACEVRWWASPTCIGLASTESAQFFSLGGNLGCRHLLILLRRNIRRNLPKKKRLEQIVHLGLAEGQVTLLWQSACYRLYNSSVDAGQCQSTIQVRAPSEKLNFLNSQEPVSIPIDIQARVSATSLRNRSI